MWFVDVGAGPLSADGPEKNEDLLTGASYGTAVTVQELVVVASSGGGNDQWANWDDYQYYYSQDPEETGTFEEWTAQFEQEADQFGSDHVTGDPNLAVYQQAKQAMTALYAAAKLADPATLWPAPGGAYMTQAQFLQSITQTNIVIAPITLTGIDAYTDVNGSTNVIYIDPSRLSDDISGFGAVKGLNYTIYHEIAHASVAGEAGWNNPNREAIANEYGQLFAEIVGAQYPTDSELSQAGGTVPRH